MVMNFNVQPYYFIDEKDKVPEVILQMRRIRS